MTLEEAIASYEKSAEMYHKAFLHCKAHGGEFYNEEAESNKICYEHDRQLADWLRELKERRKAPEIVRCGECKHASTDATCCLVCNREGMGLRPYHVHSDDYCSYAERRTE